MIDSKGNTWEWEETPAVVKAVQRLHNDYRELHDKKERAKIKQEDDKKDTTRIPSNPLSIHFLL